MRRLPICIFTIILILNASFSAAQMPVLRFDESTWDFGAIPEAGGEVTHRFAFANRGGRPVVITDAVVTCGCTVPAYSKKPVLPGERSEIAVTYDPMNRPGSFDKTVSVFTSEGGDPVRLHITGRVIPRERSDEELYPCDLGGGLRAMTTGYEFGYVRHGTAQQSAIGLINLSSRPIELRLRYGRRSGRLTASAPARFAPGEKTSLNFGYDLPVGCGVYGTLTDEIGFTVDGRPAEGWIEVSGVAVDNPLLYSDNSAPRAEINGNIVKFGPIKRSSGPSTRWISLRNAGEQPLTVRAVENSVFGCTLRPGDRIAPGGEMKVGVRLTPAECDYGVAVERIRIVTDDPEHPMLTVRVTAVIER